MQEPPSLSELLALRRSSGSTPGQRDDPWRLALSVEGGGMRGTVSGGMLAALEEANCLPLFDSVYGSSIGATSGAYFVAGQARWAADTFELAARRPGFIRLARLVEGEVLDLAWLFSALIADRRRLDAEAVLESPIVLHPLLLRATWRQARSARQEFLRRGLAWDASALLWSLERAARAPCLCGWPLGAKRREAWDAGLVEALPGETPRAHGATHLLVLRSRAAGQGPGLAPPVEAAVRLGVRATGQLLAHQSLVAYSAQARRLEAGLDPYTAMIAPADQQLPGSLCADPELLRTGRQAGYAAAERWIAGTLSPTRRLLDIR